MKLLAGNSWDKILAAWDATLWLLSLHLVDHVDGEEATAKRMIFLLGMQVCVLGAGMVSSRNVSKVESLSQNHLLGLEIAFQSQQHC